MFSKNYKCDPIYNDQNNINHYKCKTVEDFSNINSNTILVAAPIAIPTGTPTGAPTTAPTSASIASTIIPVTITVSKIKVYIKHLGGKSLVSLVPVKDSLGNWLVPYNAEITLQANSGNGNWVASWTSKHSCTSSSCKIIAPARYTKSLSGPRECTNKGYPSQDNGIRLYSNTDCNALNGIFHGNGECTKKEGGSFSWDCRDLNKTTGSVMFNGAVCKIRFY
jgi:hypothetical protein